jgi:hypothetical protein
MSLTTEEAVNHLLALAPSLDEQVAAALPGLFEDAVDAGATLDLLDSGTSISLRWMVAGAWTSVLLVRTGTWDRVEINGSRVGRRARVTTIAERALGRALPRHGGSDSQLPSYDLAALALVDSQVALREAFEEIGAAALQSMLDEEDGLPRVPWSEDDLAVLRSVLHPDLVVVMDHLARTSPERTSMAELGAVISRSGRGVSSLFGSLSGSVRSRFGRHNWPFQGEETPKAWLYWMEPEQARAWRAASKRPGPGDASNSRDRRPTLTEVNEVLHVSGLWSSYGVVADVLGRPGAARALANENWSQDRGRIARKSGLTESTDSDREREWRDQHPAEIAVHEAFGYVLDRPWPREWFASEDDILMLLGRKPATAALRLRLDERLTAIASAADAIGDPHVRQAVDQLRHLLGSLN